MKNSKHKVSWEPYSGWGDRENHLVFLVRLDKKTKHQIKKIVSQFSNIKNFLNFPEDYLHITIKPWGFIHEKERDLDFTLKEVEQISRELKPQFEKFTINIQGIHFFDNLMYFGIEDNAEFQQLNRQLIEHKKIPESYRDGDNFIPHISIGTVENVEECIQEISNVYFKIPCTIDSFELVLAKWKYTKYPVFSNLKTYSAKKSDNS